ncbi:hypothetical protein [Paenisporosarcina sp. TG20]|uniref:hypothetical protein n=1 Tax=Paenisporosarcina sp. TG20 TaxID=1211706 RepID=UPI00035EEA03|nr:hypothetical protein [Paenisporosarcina sp. TG20]
MSKMRRIFFYIGNLFIGIISYYSFLYFWMLLSWGDPIRFFSVETLITLCISTVIFLGYNYLLLRQEINPKKYWWIALGVTLFSIIAIVSIIEYS